jgi:ParB-like chromosome segregation protein Spo0J
MDKSYETHRYAELFPEMARDEFTELVKSIRENGLIDPITMLEGKVLDGRSRLRACIEAGVEPRFVKFDGLQDPLMFVWSKNFARRHLDLKQRVMLALRLKEMVAAAARERMSKGGKISAAIRSGEEVTNLSPLADGEKGKTVDKLAELAHVGRGTMQAALEVKRDAPELLADVEAGTLSVSAAAKKAKAKTGKVAEPKPGALWKKVVADCEKLNADLSAFEVSDAMPETGEFEKLRIVAERILAYLDTFNKGPGE